MSDEPMEQMAVRLDRATYEGLRRWAEDEDRTMAQQVRRVIKSAMPVKFLTPKCPTSLTGSPDGCRCDPSGSDEQVVCMGCGREGTHRVCDDCFKRDFPASPSDRGG